MSKGRQNMVRDLQSFNEPGFDENYDNRSVRTGTVRAIESHGSTKRGRTVGVGNTDTVSSSKRQKKQLHTNKVKQEETKTNSTKFHLPMKANGAPPVPTRDVIELLDDDDDNDNENLNVKPRAIETAKDNQEIIIIDEVLDPSDVNNRKPPPAAASREPPENPETRAFMEVIEIVPYVEEKYLKKMLREQLYNVAKVVSILLDSDYPVQIRPIAIDTTATTNHYNTNPSAVVIRGGRKSLGPKYDYSTPSSFEPSSEYRSQVIDLLLYDFCFLKKNTVRTLLTKNHGRYTLTRNYIHDTIIGKSCRQHSDGRGVAAAAGSDVAEKEENQHYHTLKAILLRGKISNEIRGKISNVMVCIHKPRTKIGVAVPALTDLVLKDEHCHYEKKFNEWINKMKNRLKRQAARQYSLDSGSAVTCGICYDDVSKEECVPCKEKGHLFCRDCIIQYVESQVFGSGNLGIDLETKKPALEIKCCDSDGCTSGFRDINLMKVLPTKTWEKYNELQHTVQVQRAGLLGKLSTCPKCGYQAELAQTQMIFECPVQDCRFSSCKKCGKASHIPLRCEEVAQQKRQDDGRLKIEEALSEAKMRVCPRCKKKFIKSDGCNKMTCACGMNICYVCNTPLDKIQNPYAHFCQTPHCDHSSCGKCRLYTNDEEDDAQAMRDAGLAAKKEFEDNLKKAEGGKDLATNVQFDVDQIMHDPTKGQRRRRQRERVPQRVVVQAIGNAGQRREQQEAQILERRLLAARRDRYRQIEAQQRAQILARANGQR